MPPRNFVKGRSQSRWSWHHLQQCVCVDAWFLLGNSPCCCPLGLCLKPVFMILLSSGQDGFGFSVPCSFTNFCHYESPASFLLPLPPFPVGCHLSLTLPRWHGWQWGSGGFQENEGFTTGRTTFPFVLSSPALVWIWGKELRVSLDGVWSNLA